MLLSIARPKYIAFAYFFNIKLNSQNVTFFCFSCRPKLALTANFILIFIWVMVLFLHSIFVKIMLVFSIKKIIQLWSSIFISYIINFWFYAFYISFNVWLNLDFLSSIRFSSLLANLFWVVIYYFFINAIFLEFYLLISQNLLTFWLISNICISFTILLLLSKSNKYKKI